jgi:hypothetical protein
MTTESSPCDEEDEEEARPEPALEAKTETRNW